MTTAINGPLLHLLANQAQNARRVDASGSFPSVVAMSLSSLVNSVLAGDACGGAKYTPHQSERERVKEVEWSRAKSECGLEIQDDTDREDEMDMRWLQLPSCALEY